MNSSSQFDPRMPGSRLTRRGWLRLTAGSLAASGVGLGSYVYGVEPHWVEVVRRPLLLPNLPEPLRGKTLVQISDLHIGSRVDPRFMARALRLVSEVSPDILVITGDIVNGNDDAPLDESVGIIARNLSMDRIATIACLGNHDYGHRWCDLEKADELTNRLRDTGINLLRNQSVDVMGLTVVGLEDRWGTNWNEDLATVLIGRAKPDIVLAHNPDLCDEPIWSDFNGWVLSGHTHGGQCKPPFLPPPVIPVRNKRYTAGEFELSNGRSLYINRALGYLHRVRFLVRPEITVFELTQA